MALHPLCRIDEIEEGACREFEISTDSAAQPLQIFLVKHLQRIYAYRNQCPHTGVTLNWLANQFMDMDNEYIQCATHGALFRVDDGYCLHGPCAGASLLALDIVQRDHQLYLNWNQADASTSDENIPPAPAHT